MYVVAINERQDHVRQPKYALLRKKTYALVLYHFTLHKLQIEIHVWLVEAHNLHRSEMNYEKDTINIKKHKVSTHDQTIRGNAKKCTN